MHCLSGKMGWSACLKRRGNFSVDNKEIEEGCVKLSHLSDHRRFAGTYHQVKLQAQNAQKGSQTTWPCVGDVMPETLLRKGKQGRSKRTEH